VTTGERGRATIATKLFHTHGACRQIGAVGGCREGRVSEIGGFDEMGRRPAARRKHPGFESLHRVLLIPSSVSDPFMEKEEKEREKEREFPYIPSYTYMNEDVDGCVCMRMNAYIHRHIHMT
jgi:hypothetical protein